MTASETGNPTGDIALEHLMHRHQLGVFAFDQDFNRPLAGDQDDVGHGEVHLLADHPWARHLGAVPHNRMPVAFSR